MRRTYKIQPRPADLGGGWHLKLYENNQEAGGGIYPIQEEEPHVGVGWWNGLPETRRSHWLVMAASAMPATARHAYLLAENYNNAMGEGSLGRPETRIDVDSQKRHDDSTSSY